MDYEEEQLLRLQQQLQQIQDKEGFRRRARMTAVFVIIFFCLVALVKGCYDDSVKQKKFHQDVARQQKEWCRYRKQMPESHLIERKNFICGTTLNPLSMNTECGSSEFVFDNPFPSNNAFVVVGNVNKADEGYIKFFIKKGERLRISLPYGSYDEFLMIGNDSWYGDSRKFGLETRYFRSGGFIHVDKNFCTQYWSERLRRKWGRTSKPTIKEMPYKQISEQEFEGVMRKFGIENWLEGNK